MRWLLGSIAALGWAVLGVACNTVDPSECWPNTSGGTIPIGSVGASSGDFPASPGQGPLDYGGVPNPCIYPQDACNQKCESHYNEIAAVCGEVESDAERQACQDAAYATYQSCRSNCRNSNPCRKDCEDKAEACEAECRKLPKDDKKGRQQCWLACNNAYAECIKKCKD